MIQFICFGSGSSGNCYYLNVDGYGIVIDLGIGYRAFKKYFRDYGLSFDKIQAILVTHDHTDHVKSVGSLSAEFKVPVYAASAVHEGMQRNYFMSRKIAADLRHDITPDASFALGAVQVTPFTVPHDSSANHGYCLTFPSGNRFCLITDAGEFTPTLCKHISQATYLVVESNYDALMLEGGPYPPYLRRRIASPRGHADNACTAATLSTHLSEGARRVWLCHLSEENNHPELARKTVENALHSAQNELSPQLQLEVLKRKVPSELYTLE